MSGLSTPRGPLAKVGRALFLVLAAVFVTALAWVLWIAAHIGWHRYYPPAETPFMSERVAQARAKNPKLTFRYPGVPLARVSANLQRAMVLGEDAKFAEHGRYPGE